MGIHDEPGRRRDKIKSANEHIEEMPGAVVTDLPYESGDEVAVMINGLGGTPISEFSQVPGRWATCARRLSNRPLGPPARRAGR